MESGNTDHVDVHNIFKGLGHHHDGAGMGLGAGLGGGLLGGILAGALFGRRGGVFGSDGDGGAETRINDSVFGTAVLTKLGNIEAAIPLAEAQTQNAILAQTGQLTTMMTTNANASAIATAGVKDAVQTLSLFLSNQLNTVNQNVSEQGCQTRTAIATSTAQILDKINSNTIAELQAQLAEERGRGRSREVEVNVSQNVNQQQAQAQIQAQVQNIAALLPALLADVQTVKQGQVIFNSGLMSGSGTQAAANTRVA